MLPMINFFSWLIDYIYKNNFSFYSKIYFLYKQVSDRSTIRFLKKNIKEKMVVLDIGANIGFYSLFLSKLVGPKGKVYSFEPDPLNYKHLKYMTKHHQNIFPYRLAVGHRNQDLLLFVSDKLNVDHQTYDSGEKRKKLRVKCVRLDTFLEEKTIDFIKLHIQGFEYYALLGMQKLLKNSKNLMMIGEFWPYGLSKSGISPEKYIKFLEKQGFQLTFENKNFKNKKDDKSYYTNLYAIKK